MRRYYTRIQSGSQKKRSERTISARPPSSDNLSPVRGCLPRREPRVYRLSIYGNQTMSSSVRQQGRFDDAAVGRAAGDPAYIDQVDSATDKEEESLSDFDDDVFFDDFDVLRVEDEDWEIAERGLSFSFSFALRLTFSPGRLH